MSETLTKIKRAYESGRLNADLIVTNIERNNLSIKDLLGDAGLAKGIFSDFKFGRDFLLKTLQQEGVKLSRLRDLLPEEEYQALETIEEEDRLERERAEKAERAEAERAARRQLVDDIRKGKYDDALVRGMVDEGMISREQLRTEVGWSYEKIADVMEDMQETLPPPPLPNAATSELPTEERTDVFTFGVAGSGKSLFLGALFAYADSIGKYRTERAHRAAAVYADFLMNCVKRGHVVQGTAYNLALFMSITFKNKRDHEKKKLWGLGGVEQTPKFHPLNFIEMSGEVFQDIYTTSENTQIVDWLKNYLFKSKNKKIFFFALDYFLHTASGSGREKEEALTATQSQQFMNALTLLRQEKVLKDTLGICLLITKWDLCPNPGPEAGKAFLEKYYKNLYETCRDLTKEYRDLKFKVFTFSLGNVSKRNTYTFKPENSAGIFDWLCDLAHYELIEPA